MSYYTTTKIAQHMMVLAAVLKFAVQQQMLLLNDRRNTV